MSNRLQVILNSKEYSMVKSVAHSEGTSLSDWVRKLIRDRLARKKSERNKDVMAVFKSLELPAPPIGQLLQEIEEGRR